jgi:hypothetical protein
VTKLNIKEETEYEADIKEKLKFMKIFSCEIFKVKIHVGQASIN